MASSDNTTTTVVVIVFVSFGGLLFLGCVAVAVCCLIKKKKKERVDEIVRLDEHLKVKKAIVEGPHGPQAVVLEIEDDVHLDKVIHKDDKFGKALHSKPLEIEESSAASSNHSHPQLQN
ncbi:tracheary element differentiation-related 6 [Euphorbia peplus]|nr:tracheary element differentiation-related 6 [Euphorbia peplus]